jgi:phenylacetate-CoA ligase
MIRTTWQERRRLESLEPAALAEHQLGRLNALLGLILPHNRFYAEKLAGVKLPLESLDELAGLPFTFKEELVSGSHGEDFAANLTYPLNHYVRYHRTSGTRGRPMVVLDTAQDWLWWIDTWQFILDAVELSPSDRVVTAFSFGPFIGFWSAHEACVARGALVVPSGGMTTLARLELMRNCQATVIFSTPSYCLHMAEVAADHHIQLPSLGLKKIIVAGEPGGSVPAIRERIESLWHAKVIDHGGASEVGPWGMADAAQRGMHVIEAEFIAEFLSVETGQPAGEGDLAELVLTTLGRAGSPVLRYRTGDLVRPTWNGAGSCRFVLLEGGVLGRADDMFVVRGVNIFPSSIEQILRSFPELIEYRVTITRRGHLDSLAVEIEDRLERPERVARELLLRLGLKVDVTCVAPGSLPRYEGKGKRFVDLRKAH